MPGLLQLFDDMHFQLFAMSCAKRLVKSARKSPTSYTSITFSTHKFVVDYCINGTCLLMCIGIYFLFVEILCALSLIASITVMYVHNRSSGDDGSLVMPTWVCLLTFRYLK